jgi:hypothetical protein
MCLIHGCDAPAVAKGLCAKHYARQRRNGDAMKTAKRGPKPDPLAVVAATQFKDWSPRTRATYVEACRRFHEVAKRAGDANPDERLQKATERITRPNGTFSVAKLNQLSIDEAMLTAKTEAAPETAPVECSPPPEECDVIALDERRRNWLSAALEGIRNQRANLKRLRKDRSRSSDLALQIRDLDKLIDELAGEPDRVRPVESIAPLIATTLPHVAGSVRMSFHQPDHPQAAFYDEVARICGNGRGSRLE